MFPAAKAHHRLEESNQMTEDDPAKVLDRLPQRCTWSVFIKLCRRARRSVTLATALFSSRGDACWIRTEHLDLDSWNSLCLLYLLFLFFAYSEMQIWLRLNLMWCHYWYHARPGHPHNPQAGFKPKTMTWSLRIGFSRYYNFTINYTIHVAYEKLYRGAKGYK